MSSLLVCKPKALILRYLKLCKQQTLCALMHLSQARSQSSYSMKPLGINNAAENGLTTPKSVFGKLISQCGLSTKSLKPRELSTPEKTSFQRVNRLLYQQTQRADFQQKSTAWLTHNSPHQRTNQPLIRCQFGIFTTQVNTEIEH
ncbi:hypothetical protein R8N28_23140 [Vibrio sp. Vb1554]|uniref:hypothetical protein n=1 Tax=Vibrio sp. Vb1554 TaxID=3074642 RepID=UPI0029662515|nr:hypothetical protein [Vibrio sp. Vb1554]MDW3048630.1 hypothetical protein [Vibrio sp. Vb1554]